MSKKRTSSELQAYIQQRYEDTAFAIHRTREVEKRRNLIGNKRSLFKVQQAFENIAEVERNHLEVGSAETQLASGTRVQSQFCVII